MKQDLTKMIKEEKSLLLEYGEGKFSHFWQNILKIFM